jgi:hypothetical protein
MDRPLLVGEAAAYAKKRKETAADDGADDGADYVKLDMAEYLNLTSNSHSVIAGSSSTTGYY